MAVVVITTHAGNKARNGGEYEFRTIFQQLDGNVEVTHETSAEGFDWNPYRGVFAPVEEGDEPTRVSLDDAVEIIAAAAPGQATRETIREALVNPEVDLALDGTGHEPVPCRWGGGCVVCYPCAHGCADADESR